MDADLRDLLEFATETAEAAGRTTRDRFGGRLASETKSDRSPVTVADREAERLCRERIEARYPTDGILGEEFGATRPAAARRWILDPIDGTRSFIRGVPLYGVLIALEAERQGLVGVMHFPALDETVAAARGLGAWWNGSAASVSDVARLDQALVLCTDVESMIEHGHGDRWTTLADRAELARTWGDCYGHALVATGRAECMLDPILAPWDVAPLQLIVEEAGGVFTDFAGRRGHLLDSGIATNRALAATVRELLIDGPDSAASMAE